MSELAAPARVALVGNPNSGKTALFNALTGSRQKVANYPGVTVERKEGLAITPGGVTVRLIDLPGTYSLRARSLDEIVTRDIVLGRLVGEDVPNLLVCVADSTNLRVALRLALELKRVCRPMILALNMFDIARHRGFEIDVDRLSGELGIPVVASVAVRRGGTSDLLARIDKVIRERGFPAAESAWSEPNAAQLRATQREADRILDAAVTAPGRPDGFTRRLDRVVLHPVLGLVILLAILFLMFQAVFTWAQAPMDLIKSGFDALARISQRGGCIGTLDLRKSCCENGLSRRQGSPMQTECSADLFGFAPVEGRKVVAAFDGGRMTSEAGALLLGATDGQLRLVERFAGCFTDCRAAELVEHTVARLVGQRVFGMALGYEDLIDHDQLRHDPVMAVLGGKLSAKRADCAPLAGKSTLNRLELSRPEPTRYHKISYDAAAIERLFVDLFLDAHSSAPPQITLDLDATDDPLHGQQEERFFHGYYDGYCYLPLYVFCGRHLLAAKLRPANIDASAGSVEETARIVAQIRQHWPKVRILLRADSGFAREALMAWCETNGVDFLFGLAKNSRLIGEIETELAAAQEHSQRTGKSARRFRDFIWQTRQSWSRERRVVAKAEWTGGEANPRFVVTSLAREEHEARHLYEKLYCARGEMENRIKECQLDLYADRTSAHTMRANQLRLWFAAMAYVLISALRRIGLTHTQFARASCGTIRLKLLKIGALVRTSVRRIKLAMPSAFPYQAEYRAAHAALTAAAR